MEWTVIAKDKMPGAPDIKGYTKRCWITGWPIRYNNILVNGKRVYRDVYYLVASYSPKVEEYDKEPSDVVFKFVFKYAIQDRYSDVISPSSVNPRELNQRFVDVDVLRGALLENDGAIDWKYEVTLGYRKPVLSVDVDEYNGVPTFNVHVGEFFAAIDSCDMRRYGSPIGQIMGNVGSELGLMCMFPGKLDFATAHAAMNKLTLYNYATVHESVGYYDKERTEAQKNLKESMEDLKQAEDGFMLVSQKSADSLNALSRDYGIEIGMEEEEDCIAEEVLQKTSGVSRPIIRKHLSNSFLTMPLGVHIRGCVARFVVNVYKDRTGKFLVELCEDLDGTGKAAKPIDANWLRGFLSSALDRHSEWWKFKLVDLNGHLYLEGEYDTEDIMPHTTPKEEFVHLSGLWDFLSPDWNGGLGDHLAIAYIFRDRISNIDEAQTVMNHIGEVFSFINELNYQDQRVARIQESIDNSRTRLSEIDQDQSKEIEDKIESLEYLKGIGVFT